MALPALVKLQAGRMDVPTGEVEFAGMVDIDSSLIALAQRMR